MQPLDEKQFRRPDFKPGTPVVLADGGEWQLRRPLMWFIPDDTNPAGFRMCLELDPDDDYQGLLDSLASGRQGLKDEAPEGPNHFIGAQLAIGRRLLLANYDLTPAQVARLMRFGYGEETNPEGCRIREDVMAVAEGLGPKPSPDGIDASLMPSGA